ncbi:MAG: hypothetical protein KAJ55_10540, partial [Anaerolineales bacterium]|nr:hypothetical protein [Anaerolineales bacterium]
MDTQVLYGDRISHYHLSSLQADSMCRIIRTFMEEPLLKPRVSTPEPELDATFDHVFEYWPVLTRRGESLAFPLSGRFVKPGGFFKWFFYWDSYFTLLGLVIQGKWQLAREIVEGFV